jgi:hypothetical protein
MGNFSQKYASTFQLRKTYLAYSMHGKLKKVNYQYFFLVFSSFRQILKVLTTVYYV